MSLKVMFYRTILVLTAAALLGVTACGGSDEPDEPETINSVAITISAPVNGATPSTTASTTDAGYTLGAVSWSPTDNPFQGGKVYTATVTLTANSGYTFTGLNSATVNGQSATVSNNTGGTVQLSYAFTETDIDIETDIEIGNPTVRLYLDGSTVPLTEGGNTNITVGTGTYTVNIDSGTYSQITWYLNGNVVFRGTSNRLITLQRRISGIYLVTVETVAGSVKNTGTHIFVVE